MVSMLLDARLLCIYNVRAGGRGCIPKVSAVNPILPLEPPRMLCTCALCPLWVLMAETVRSPFDYREPPTLDSDGDGSKPPPPRGWVSSGSGSGSDRCCCCCRPGHIWQRNSPDARAARSRARPLSVSSEGCALVQVFALILRWIQATERESRCLDPGRAATARPSAVAPSWRSIVSCLFCLNVLTLAPGMLTG